MAHEEIGEMLEGLKKDERLPPEACPLLLLIHEELAQFFPFRAGADFLRNTRALLVDLQTRMSKKDFAWGDEDKSIFRLILENLNRALKAEKRLSNQVGPFFDAVAVMMDQKNANQPPRCNTTNVDDLTQPPVKLPDEPGPAVADDHNMLTRLMHIAMLCANGDRFLLFLRNAPIDDRAAPEDFRCFLGACMDKFFPADSPAEVDEDTARWLLNLTKRFECVEMVAKFLGSHVGALQKELAALRCAQLHKLITALSLTPKQQADIFMLHLTEFRAACSAAGRGRSSPDTAEASTNADQQGLCELWAIIDLRQVELHFFLQLARCGASVPVEALTRLFPLLVELCASEQGQLRMTRNELGTLQTRATVAENQIVELRDANSNLQDRVTQVEMARINVDQSVLDKMETMLHEIEGKIESRIQALRIRTVRCHCVIKGDINFHENVNGTTFHYTIDQQIPPNVTTVLIRIAYFHASSPNGHGYLCGTIKQRGATSSDAEVSIYNQHYDWYYNTDCYELLMPWNASLPAELELHVTSAYHTSNTSANSYSIILAGWQCIE